MASLAGMKGKENVIVSVMVVALLGVMILPLPPFLMDVLLSISIALGVVIVITAVFIQAPLDFFVFPSLLLMTTLYRLSLNVATTRLILLKGNEGPEAVGQVIKSFGSFVVGGNYVVGFIIFLILVLVNFLVITKGSVRIAEVAARFTLDAMPGKQMAIDADLNTGLINEDEARMRRGLISQEADFYGSMDGAAKFVRGDAIAGIVITGINIVGGLIIGALQHGMPVVDALKTYTVLTVGDGLVTQIPALLISTAAGIIVSRAGKESELGKDLASQVLFNPKVLVTTSGLLFVVGLVPGLPHVPFLLISALAGGLSYYFFRAAGKEQEAEALEEATPEAVSEEPRIESLLELDPLSLEIGYGLIPLVENQGELLRKLKAMRRQLAQELGFVVPSIHIKDNLQLRPHEYSFLIRGIEVARGEVMSGHWLAVRSEGDAQLDGVPTTEPAFGLPAYWVEQSQVEQARLEGFMVVDPATMMVTHITELIRKNAWELLSRTEVQGLLDNVSRVYPKLVDELVPEHMALGQVQRVLQNLLKERVPVRDMVTILESLLDYAPQTKDVEQLTEFARQALSRFISKQYMTPDGSIPVYTVDPRFERALSRTMSGGEPMAPDLLNKLVGGIRDVVTRDAAKGAQTVILCSSQIRRILSRLLEKFLPSVVILSNAEISPAAKLYTLGMVKYED